MTKTCFTAGSGDGTAAASSAPAVSDGRATAKPTSSSAANDRDHQDEPITETPIVVTPGEVWHACHFSAVTGALHNGEVVGAPRGNRLEHLQTTRETIRDAAMDLFEAVGFADTTAQAIAERAGVSLRTFFRYFDCKEATLFGADLQDWSLRYIEERPRSESLVESLHETGLALWQAG